MNVIKIVVDELPENCARCNLKFSVYPSSYCVITSENIRLKSKVRPSWCPLVVDITEKCFWDNDHDGYSYHYTTACGELMTMHNREFTFCPNCGKRIKYVEEE